MSSPELQSAIQQTVIPHLICDGAARAIDFYRKAFGAVEMMRLPGKDGRLMHACVQIGMRMNHAAAMTLYRASHGRAPYRGC
jgi:PhnB protein